MDEKRLLWQHRSGRAQEFWNQHAEWSQATFGTDAERGPLGALRHLEKESREAQDEAIAVSALKISPTHLREEIADCLFLTFDAARRSGMTLDTLLDTAFAKLKINRGRVWQKPAQSDMPVEHVREVDPREVGRIQTTPFPPSILKETNGKI